MSDHDTPRVADSFSRAEIEAFVADWYRKLDIHAPAEELISMVADQEMCIRDRSLPFPNYAQTLERVGAADRRASETSEPPSRYRERSAKPGGYRVAPWSIA